LHETPEVIIAKDSSSLRGKVSTIGDAGDVIGETGRVWRRVKRPSDMNEYADELRSYRERDNGNGKVGKAFVRCESLCPALFSTFVDCTIDQVTKLVLPGIPIPRNDTYFKIIMDNGLQAVETGEFKLKLEQEVDVASEFEL
jgi:hypothetical protein